MLLTLACLPGIQYVVTLINVCRLILKYFKILVEKMNEFKIIRGGKKKEAFSGNKLFAAQSNVSNVACFHWFVFERPQPLAPYKILIEDYSHLNDEKKHYAQDLVDEYFTMEEIEALKKFFLKYNITSSVRRADIPFPKKQQNNFLPLKEIMYRVAYMGTYMLSEIHKDYDLPFEVCGAIDLKHVFLTKPYVLGNL